MNAIDLPIGGSGICKGMTEALLRHGAKAFIVGRRSPFYLI